MSVTPAATPLLTFKEAEKKDKKEGVHACMGMGGGLFVVMERLVLWGGCDDKRKIQTGQSFPFANRAPDKGSVCSSTDRRAISLLLPFSPSPCLSLSS